jgi:hypothetical protein
MSVLNLKTIGKPTTRLQGSEIEKLRSLASAKFLKLLEIFDSEKTITDEYDDAAKQNMMNITFVKRKFTARSLCEMLQQAAKLGKLVIQEHNVFF